jgi:hypothetical protein
VFVLATIGPFGPHWNTVVWPWNVVMAGFTVILYTRSDEVSRRQVFGIDGRPFQKIVMVLFVVLPVLSFVDVWDAYLSSSLYSRNTTRGETVREQDGHREFACLAAALCDTA